MSLTPGARIFYQCMAMDAGGKQQFQFTHGDAKKYSIPPASYNRYVDELIAAEFIARVYKEDPEDQWRFDPNIFRFISDWKNQPPISK